MSQLVIAVTGKTLWATGERIRFWADVQLALKDHTGNFHQRTFRVDTATDLATFPAYEARQLNLPLPIHAATTAVHTQTGLEIRSGTLLFRIIGMDTTVYDVPCLFLGDPNTPPNLSQPATLPRNLLQPFALLDVLRFNIEKNRAGGSLYGDLVVEKV